MITQNLIDLIHSGKAKYQTWTAGYTGSFRIPVPKNNYIVITDFTIFNFMDNETVEQPDPPPDPPVEEFLSPLKNCIHNVLFKSYGNEFLYVHRSNFIGIANPDPVSGRLREIYMPLTNTDKYDTYQVHKSDVHIDTWRIPPVSENNFNFNTLNDKTTETDGPQGYGTTSTPNSNKVVRGIQLEQVFDPTDIVIPYGENQGTPPLGFSEKLRSHINLNTSLYPPYPFSSVIRPNDDGMFTFPLFNIGYVLVNEAFDKTDR